MQDITWVIFLFQKLKVENSLFSSFRVALAVLKTTFMHRNLSFTKSLSNNNYHIASTIQQLGCTLFFTDLVYSLTVFS